MAVAEGYEELKRADWWMVWHLKGTLEWRGPSSWGKAGIAENMARYLLISVYVIDFILVYVYVPTWVEINKWIMNEYAWYTTSFIYPDERLQ